MEAGANDPLIRGWEFCRVFTHVDPLSFKGLRIARGRGSPETADWSSAIDDSEVGLHLDVMNEKPRLLERT